MKAMNYTKNYRPKHVNFTQLRHQESQMQGFKVGVLAMAWIMTNSYEIENKELHDMVKEALDFVAEIGLGKKDPVKVNETLREMTGIDILIGE